MIEFIDFCEVLFLPESVEPKLMAITAATRLDSDSKRLWMCSWGTADQKRSFHTLPKFIWCGSWGCNPGQSMSNCGPHVFYRRKIWRASRPGKKFKLMIEELLNKECHVWSRIILLI
ncbi:uncharacterized protein TNCV_139951 [Trichonephila clavipes]|uniref:Uncharacterized protein n=1 Tax=Trichonephila clavipes TaxID=2585209 RepID=A0A8X6RK54_TRICX|nr:uncharacterized protein TNCV_139951 [Trichonephila clavipes]